MSTRELNEPELPDDYPIYGDYWYVADGKPIRSDWHGITAKQFKAKIGAKVLCRCDIYGRRAIAANAAASNHAEQPEPVRSEAEPPPIKQPERA